MKEKGKLSSYTIKIKALVTLPRCQGISALFLRGKLSIVVSIICGNAVLGDAMVLINQDSSLL
jgi:hypothetical protein